MDSLVALKTIKTIEVGKQVTSEHKVYIKVSFAQKEKAKALGARWDASVKSWYYIPSQLADDKIQELKKI